MPRAGADAAQGYAELHSDSVSERVRDFLLKNSGYDFSFLSFEWVTRRRVGWPSASFK